MTSFTEAEVEIMVKYLENELNIQEYYYINNYSIGNIKNLTLKFSKSEAYFLNIESYDYDTHNRTIFEIISLSLRTIVESLFNLREEYKYSKIKDYLIEKEVFETEETLTQIFRKLNDENKMEDCCVCFENNVVTTSCHHNLCRPCYSRLKWFDDDEEEEGILKDEIAYKLCPMCRTKLYR